jgi:amino-acid N-acetyltransferase
MPPTAIGHARPGDLDEVKALLETAGLAADGTPDRLAGFIVAREDGRMVGVAGLEDHETAGLLRSVAVASDRRNRGLGAALVSRLIRRSRRRGHEAIYLLTRTAEEYFARFGFRRVERSEVRPSVATARQFASQACECSAVMVLELGTAVGGPDAQGLELARHTDVQES